MDSKERCCHKCGERGHVAKKCRNNDKCKTNLKCYVCGKSGHLRRDCPGVEDDGAGQSKFKGKHSAGPHENLSRGQKSGTKLRDEVTPVALPSLLDVNFIDMHCSAAAFPSALSTGELFVHFPREAFKGAVLSYPMDPSTFSFPMIDEFYEGNTPGALRGELSATGPTSDYTLGYYVGINPVDAAAYLNYHSLSSKLLPSVNVNEGDVHEPSLPTSLSGYENISRELIRLLHYRRVVGFGPAGIDYSKGFEDAEEQKICLLLQINALVCYNSQKNADGLGHPMPAADQGGIAQDPPEDKVVCGLKYLLLRLNAPIEHKRPATDTFFGTHGPLLRNVDADLIDIMENAFPNVSTVCELPLVVQISSCGITWPTIQYLMRKFRFCYFSIDCRLTHLKQKLLREYAFDLPLSRIVLESNSPLFPPSGPEGGSGHAHSGHVIAVAQVLSEIKSLSMEETCKACYENSLFLIKAS